jgi:hypothetical protein
MIKSKKRNYSEMINSVANQRLYGLAYQVIKSGIVKLIVAWK